MVHEKKKELCYLNRSHIWMISLGMLNAYYGYNDKYPVILKKYKGIWKKLQSGEEACIPDILLHGVPKPVHKSQSNDFFNDALEFMQNYFHIHTKNDFLIKATLDINNSVMLQTYAKRRNILLALPMEQRVYFIANNDDMFNFINYFESSLTPAGILGYEISTHVQMCRLAFYLGYISRDELFQFLRPDAMLAQRNFNSFHEYGLSCLVGLLFYWQFYNSHHSKNEPALVKLLNWFLKSKASPWTNLSWNTVIGNS